MIILKKIQRGCEYIWYEITPVIVDSGVYMLYDKNDYLIYIGQSKNINQRIQQHCKNENKDWSYAKVILIDNKEHRLIIEKLLIAYIKPSNNKISPSCLNINFNLDTNKLIEMQKKTLKSLSSFNLLQDFIDNLNENNIIDFNTYQLIYKKIMNSYIDIINLNSEIASYLDFSKIHLEVNDNKPFLFDNDKTKQSQVQSY